jgi:Xaa-Pro dipeptidase
MAIITDSEYKLRIDKIQDLLLKNDLDALFVTLGKNFQYVLKSSAHLSERLVCGIIPSSGNPQILCPAFEVINFSKTPIKKENLHLWQETEDVYEKLHEITANLGLLDGNIGLSPDTPFHFYSKMAKKLPKALITNGYSIFLNARMTKTETELNCLRKANEVTSEGIEASFQQVKEGMTEKELSQIVIKELGNRSHEVVQFAAVQFGENSADPHGQPTDKKLKKGDVTLIDAGTTIEGYNGDITNTSFFGKPTKEFLEIYGVVEEAQELAVKSAFEGSLSEDVDNASRKYIAEKGYGSYFTHRTGHGIGLDVHEEPYIVGGNKEPLLMNQAHSVEPGIYLEGKFGVRIEDIVFVGRNSGERSAQVSRRLWEK